MTTIVGIDPGLKGAIVMVDVISGTPATGKVRVFDIPTHEVKRNNKFKNEVDLPALVRIIEQIEKPAFVFIERVNAMPGQGVTSMFNFGMVFGMLRGIVAGRELPVTLITPAVWKKAMGLNDSKAGARVRASELAPACSELWKLVKHDGRAEAFLLALYGWGQMGGTTIWNIHPVTEKESLAA